LADWRHAEQDPSDELCLLQHFAVKKRQPGGDIEFTITVREYVHPPDPAMKFLAQADKQTNQKTVPFTPAGWVSFQSAFIGVHRRPVILQPFSAVC
jgi:hypothetical protein